MKRKSINKLLSTVMVAAMSAGLLAGCGASAGTDTAATTPMLQQQRVALQGIALLQLIQVIRLQST